ncbi:DMT family transporter [Shewanella surugensis]|uniref:DMT family transporter n=1 Tax=Shewanella surugensis TaxID=212020 RepID=A0ABT0LFY2_9GAMM|nr:DMT family transporter [Shewanella surugensis]MCL1126619.1 DMT family transporter [Shewanella surugensis]
MSVFLYVLMIFIWGLSWIAIKWQQGDVATLVSIFYRFAIAALLLCVFGKLFNKLQVVKAHHHVFLALQGLCLFCFNFIAFYYATHYIPSGLTAVIMASAPIFNALHGKLFYQTQTRVYFWVGMLVGLMGISLMFVHDFETATLSRETFIGMALSLLGTWCFSIGNMISIRNTREHLQPYTATTYAIFYGCIALLMMIVFQGIPFTVDVNYFYLGSLAYLAIPASVMGFTLYLILVDRIGAHNAAYVLVLTPIIALISSSLFEGYQWTPYSTFGLILILIGNLIAQWKVVYFRQIRKRLAFE